MNPTTVAPTALQTRAVEPEPDTIGAMVLDVAARFAGVALQYPRAGRPEYVSYAELGTIASEIARGLISLGVAPGERVAILGTTSAQWTLADLGSMCAGAVVTPVYHTNSAQECAYVLRHSAARLVFCENADQAAKIAAVRDRLPDLAHVVLFEGEASGAITLDRLRRAGAEVPPDVVLERVHGVAPTDVATLVYTSGTTGPPKGCMLSHENFLSTTRMYAEQLNFTHEHSMFQFLPLAHVLARVAQTVALSVGARVVYWSGDATKLVDELAASESTHFPAVPRIYEKLHGAVTGRMEDGTLAQRVLFRWALQAGRQVRPALRAGQLPGLVNDVKFRVADRLILSRIRALFGPRLQLAMVGAAPVGRELLEFFDTCGVTVLEGYGLTETCAAATMNTVDALRFGSVGKPLPGTEVAVAPDGEVLIRGPEVFLGYHRDPEATSNALDADGWLHTGDLGQIDDAGFLHITGRKKDLIITSSGKNITPVNIESLLRESRYIAEAVVYGDNRPYLVAAVTLEADEAAHLAEHLGVDNDPRTLARDERVRAAVAKEIEAVNARLARIEQIKRFAILEHDLSQASGELTPTLKVKRAAVYDKYADTFAGLYEEVRS